MKRMENKRKSEVSIEYAAILEVYPEERDEVMDRLNDPEYHSSLEEIFNFS